MSGCRHVCPYHASRDVLQEGAALIFVTYSQLLDPPMRSANGLDDLLEGAVLVFDEASPPSALSPQPLTPSSPAVDATVLYTHLQLGSDSGVLLLFLHTCCFGLLLYIAAKSHVIMSMPAVHKPCRSCGCIDPGRCMKMC